MPFDNLLSSTRIKSMELKNRMVMLPMTTNYATTEGFVTERLKDYYEERARGGIGLIIVEAGCVYYPQGKVTANQLGLYHDKLIPGLEELVEVMHKHGTKVAFQLHHAGKRASRHIIGCQPVSSSSIPIKVKEPDWIGGELPRALGLEEIRLIEEAFANAAARAKKAGADAVEIHGAHGYLILNFLSHYSNVRTDEYGGNIHGRTRFAKEIVQLVKQNVGDDFPVLFRISADEYVDGCLTLEDTKVICQILEEAGVDAFDVSTGNHDSIQAVIPPAVFPPGFRVYLAEGIKQAVNVPVIASGRINSPELAEKILGERKADLVGLGRGLIADPEFPSKVAQGRANEIRKCIGCNEGCIGRLRKFDREGNGLMTCVQNPMVGHEREYAIEPAKEAKKVVVVGGGPAGMEASLVAALKGHEVTLFEREKILGGQLNLAIIPPYKSEIKNIISYFESQFARLGVRINLGVEATPELIQQAQPGIIILATGATPIIPAIPIANGKVFTAWDVLRGTDVGERIVVVGGGTVGCETAEFLAERGKEVTIVEKMSDIARDLEPIRRGLLRERLTRHRVKIQVNTDLRRIEGGYVITGKNRSKIEADAVVFAVGAQPNTGLEQFLTGKGRSVYCIGDCAAPSNMLEAIHRAFHAAKGL